MRGHNARAAREGIMLLEERRACIIMATGDRKDPPGGGGTQYLFNETPIPVTPTESFAQRGTPEDLLKIAEHLWSVAKEKADTHKAKDILNLLHAENKDFAVTFPVIVRWMVDARQFSSRAFMQFITIYAKNRAEVKTRKDYWKLQADYPVLLFRERHKHKSLKDINKYRDDLTDALVKEDEEFQKVLDEFKASIKQEDLDQRQKLIAQLKAKLSK
jgi:hypothetical protein